MKNLFLKWKSKFNSSQVKNSFVYFLSRHSQGFACVKYILSLCVSMCLLLDAVKINKYSCHPKSPHFALLSTQEQRVYVCRDSWYKNGTGMVLNVCFSKIKTQVFGLIVFDFNEFIFFASFHNIPYPYFCWIFWDMIDFWYK